MKLQIDIPDTIINRAANDGDLAEAWVWMVIQKTTLKPEWHVSEWENKGHVMIDVKDGKNQWVFRSIVTVMEGKPSGRSLFASDNPPNLVTAFIYCQKYEPKILEEITN